VGSKIVINIKAVIDFEMHETLWYEYVRSVFVSFVTGFTERVVAHHKPQALEEWVTLLPFLYRDQRLKKRFAMLVIWSGLKS
jgi:hypothetical protein